MQRNSPGASACQRVLSWAERLFSAAAVRPAVEQTSWRGASQ